MKANAMQEFPMKHVRSPSNPLSVRCPNAGVNTVYVTPNVINTSPVSEDEAPKVLFMKGSKEAEYQDQATPANQTAKVLTGTAK